MDNDLLPLLIRGVERLLIVCFGGLFNLSGIQALYGWLEVLTFKICCK
jgi:hypothetical protein